ncbi:hypothetical protein OJAV_G00163700 [Oryzias javanicus]|uniref:Uncharacterized protein n=1 Tax=Oryzias javanicus TaxID=123683 RepID=A0A3S2NZQ7_ORYJA|nr:hypothetical protein OJAV_G00163700 [Oryzias javanicus]
MAATGCIRVCGDGRVVVVEEEGGGEPSVEGWGLPGSVSADTQRSISVFSCHEVRSPAVRQHARARERDLSLVSRLRAQDGAPPLTETPELPPDNNRFNPLNSSSLRKSFIKGQSAGAQTIKHGRAQDGRGPLQQHAVLVGGRPSRAVLPDAGTESGVCLCAAALHLPGTAHRALLPHPAGPLPQHALVQLDRPHGEGHL